jgi:hypothetical protein
MTILAANSQALFLGGGGGPRLQLPTDGLVPALRPPFPDRHGRSLSGFSICCFH